MHILAELSPLDPVAGSRVTIRASTAQDRAINALNGVRWWPAIKPDVGPLRIALFDGNFTTDIEPGSIRLTLMTDHLAKMDANARRYIWAGASVTIYADAKGTAWPWTTRLVGKVDSFQAEGNEVQLQIAVDQEPFQRNVLTAAYAGTTGIEGDADLKNKPKPMALGRLRNIEPVLIDAANSVFQFHAYGPVQAVNALYERGSVFAASVGDYATYAALVAASIPAGRYGTCLAQGLVRLGAPPNGVITVDVDGDKPSTWLSKTGEIISRVATNAGISAGQIDSASLTALDTAISTVTGGGGVIGVYVTEQETVLDFARRLARPCNATAGVSLLGKLFAVRVAIGTAQMTLDAQCRQQPGVFESSELPVSPPYARIEMTANRAWRVHNYDEIAFYAELIDLGTYSGSTTYREGNIVYQPTDGRTYLYTATTPTAGNAPPNVTYWALYQAGDPGIAGNANRVRFSQFEGGTVGWALNWNPNGISSGALSIGTSSGISFVRLDGTATAASQRYALGIPAAYRFAVTPGERLSVQLKLKASGAVGSTGAFLVFVNAAGAAVGSTITFGTATGVTPYSGSEWFDARTFTDVPAGAVAAYIEIHNISSGAGAMQAYLAQPMVTQAGADQVLHPSFSPGPNAADGADVTAVNAALGTNLVVNSELLNDAEGWTVGGNGTVGGTVQRGLNYSSSGIDYYGQINVLYARFVGTPTAGTYYNTHWPIGTDGDPASFRRYSIPVFGGERFYFSWLISVYRGTGTPIINWYDGDGNWISGTEGEAVTNNYGSVNGDPATMFRAGGFVTAPSNARFAKIGARMTVDGGANPNILMGQPFIAKVSATQVAIPPYTPGPADRSATNGAPDGTNVGSQPAATVASAVVNFNNRNDRLATAVVAPTIATDGSAVDHTISGGGVTADISFEWVWSGAEADIDGFQVLVRSSTSSSAYTVGTTPAEENITTAPAAKRAFILYGAPANLYYTFAVRAFRVVDPDVAAGGVLYSSWVKPSVAAENPYRPASSLAFSGNITGTVNSVAAATISAGASAANNGVNSDGTIKTDRVNTPAIQANAVTGSAAAFTAAAGTALTGAVTTTLDVQTLSYTSSGGVIDISAMYRWSAATVGGGLITVQITLERNGTAIYTFPSAGGSNGASGAANVTFQEQPTAGSYTYKIVARITVTSNSSNSMSFTNKGISLKEAKR